jgi:Zn-dependent oligopeptidase
MSALPKFVFDGSISLSEYREQWLARFTELEGGFAKLKLVEGHVTADDFGLQLDRIYTGVGEFESRSRQFVKLHPSKEFRDEAETAAKAFAELEIRMELDPDLAKIILRMTYEETPSLPYQQVFVKRWQERVKRSGAALPEAQRAELAKLEKELTELRSQFSRNIADGEIKWAVSDEDLKGLPVDFVASRPRDESGKVLLTTSYVDYERIMNFAESDELRKATFLKFENIAYPANEAVFKRILEVTSKRAHLLGFKSHADYVLTGRNTLHGVQAVESFINDTQVRVTPRADKEKEVMAKVYGVDRLHPWQTLRAKNALARRLYDGFDASQIQEYLLTENVIPGITELIQEVFGIRFEHRPDVKSWVDKGVECYDVYDQDSSVLMGRIYTDVSHLCLLSADGTSPYIRS